MNKILEKLMLLGKFFRNKKVSINDKNSAVAIVMNDSGNVSKLETTQILSDCKGAYETKWYFRLEPECGVSNGDYPVLATETLEHDTPIDEEMYARYSATMRKRMAETAGVDEKYIVPLTWLEHDTQYNS